MTAGATLFSAGLTAATAGGAVLGGLVYATVAPACRFWGPVISRGDRRDPPRYALTFDDGPTDDSTLRILDILNQLDAKSAFFAVGVNARRHPGIIQRIHQAGHVVGNHSYDHSHFSMMRAGRYWDRQVRDTDQLIEEIIGRKPALFRPPLGIKTLYVTRAARRYGHTLVTWTRRGLDGVATTSERIVNRLASHIQGGDIVMLHDGVEPHMRRDPSATVAALRPLMTRLRDRGLEPAPLHELIGVPAYAPARAAACSA